MSRFRITSILPLLFAFDGANAMAERPVQIVSEGKAGTAWTPAATLSEPGYPAGVDASTGDVCVNIGYYLGADGIPSQFSHLKSWSDPGRQTGEPKYHLEVFQQAAVAALQQWRFVPAKSASLQPIYTSTTFAFTVSPGADKVGLRKHCNIRDLRAFVFEAQKHADPKTWEQIRWNGEWFEAKNTRIHGLNRE